MDLLTESAPVVGRWLSKEILLLLFPPSSAAFTAMTISYQRIYEVSRNDAKWKELQERIQGYHKECSEYRQKQRQAFRKIIQFDKLEDLAMDKMGACEGDSNDAVLLSCTGQDQETWFWSWNGCEDLCFDGMVQAAIDASNAQSMIEVVKDKIKVTVALQKNRESEIRVKLETEQQEESN